MPRIKAGTYFIPFRDPDNGLAYRSFISIVPGEEEFKPGHLYEAEFFIKNCKHMEIPGTWIFFPRELPCYTEGILPLNARVGIDYFALAKSIYEPSFQLGVEFSSANLILSGA